MSEENQKRDAFLEAGRETGGNLVSELIGFMSENKKWWLSPIIIVLLLLGLLIVLGGTGLAPFIYTLF